MPENGLQDPLTQRMTALRDAATDPFTQLGVASDYLRAVGRRVERHQARRPAGDHRDEVTALLVQWAATQVWAAATLILPVCLPRVADAGTGTGECGS